MKMSWLISAFVLLALVAVLGGSYLLQVAPTPTSAKVYEYRPLNPFVQSSQDFSLRPAIGFVSEGTGAVSGISVLAWTSIRDPAIKWRLNYELKCDGLPVVNSKGVALVSGYAGENDATQVQQTGTPSSTIWVTIPMSSRFGNVSVGRICSVTLFTTTPAGERFDGLFWVSHATARTKFGSVAWVESPPPGTTSPNVAEPGPGTQTPPAKTTAGDDADGADDPKQQDVGAILILAVILVLVIAGAVLAFLAFVAD